MQTDKVACGSHAGLGVIRGALIGIAAGIYFGSQQMLKHQAISNRVLLRGIGSNTTHIVVAFSLLLGSYSALHCSLIKKYNYPDWLSSPIAGCASGVITSVIYTRSVDPRSIMRVATLSALIASVASVIQLFGNKSKMLNME